MKFDEGNDYFKCVGVGEMLVVFVYDFEDFFYLCLELLKWMEGDFCLVFEFLLENWWLIWFYCIYEESVYWLFIVLEEVG